MIRITRNCGGADIDSTARLWFVFPLFVRGVRGGNNVSIAARGQCMACGCHNIERRNYWSIASRHRQFVGPGAISVPVPVGLYTHHYSKFRQSALQ
jgi:hypothetical protein